MAEQIATPWSPAGRALVELLMQWFPDIRGAHSVDIHLGVDEPITLAVRRHATEARDCDPTRQEITAVAQRFVLHEVAAEGGGDASENDRLC